MLRGKSHGHSHGGQACNHDHDHGHSHSHGGGGGSAHGHSHAAPAHGHTHGGQPCHGHGGGHNHGASGPSGEALIALQQLQQLQAIAGKASLTECAKCQKPGSDCKLLMCGRCRSVAYCSVDHQREHWAEHKKVCPLLLKVAEHKAQVQKSIEAMKAMTFRSPHVHMQRVNENGRVGIMLRPLAEPQFQCFCHDSELHSPEIVVAYIKRDRFRQLQAHHQSGAKDWRKPSSTAISTLFQPSAQFASSDASRDLRFSFIFYRRVDEDTKDNITVEFWSFPVKDRPLNSTTGTIVRLSAYVWNPTKAAEEKNQELVPVALTDSVCCGIGDVNVVADVQASACPAVPFQTIANFQKQIIAKRLGVPHNNDQALLEANDPQFNALHAKLGSMAREELDEPHYALVFVMQHVATCSGEEELCHSVMASKMHSQADDPTESDDEECDENDGGDHSGHNHSHGHGHSHGAGSHGHDHSHSHGAGGECDGDHKDSHPMIPKWMKFGTVSNLLNKLPGKTAPFTFVPESASQETDEALAATVVTAIEPKKGGADKKKKKKKGKKKQGAAAAEEEEGEDDEDETEPGAAAV